MRPMNDFQGRKHAAGYWVYGGATAFFAGTALYMSLSETGLFAGLLLLIPTLTFLVFLLDYWSYGVTLTRDALEISTLIGRRRVEYGEVEALRLCSGRNRSDACLELRYLGQDWFVFFYGRRLYLRVSYFSNGDALLGSLVRRIEEYNLRTPDRAVEISRAFESLRSG